MAYPVPQSDPTSVIGRRVLAVLIDIIILAVPVALIVSSQFEYLEVADLAVDGQEFCDQYLDRNGGVCVNAEDIDDRVYFSDDSSGGANFVGLALNFTLFVLLQGLTGWTPGKLVTGIRLVREDGRRAGIGRAALRWLLWIVDGFPYFLPGLVGFIVGLTTTGHRRIGDMAAKTFVVKRAAAGSPIAVPGMTTAAAPPAPGGWGTPPPPGAAGSPPGWGPAGDPNAAGWASPAPAPPNAPGAPPAPPIAPAPMPTEGPQWDEARGTYIQWDPVQGAWMQWDEGFKAWSRIPGQ
jgi:uncharacterized RDD family membrane protein YckC